MTEVAPPGSYNPMAGNLHTRVMEVGQVPGKFLPDHDEIAIRMQNDKNELVRGECYQGGGPKEDHDIFEGDLLMGTRSKRAQLIQGQPNELAWTCWNGKDVGVFGSHDAMEAQHYPIGISLTDYRLSNPSNSFIHVDPDHGGACAKAGAKTIINSGPYAAHPGTKMRWRAPPSKFSPYTLQANDNQFGDPYNKRARGSNPPNQLKTELVPFIASDFAVQIAGAFIAMITPKSYHRARGISDLAIQDFLPQPGVTNGSALNRCQDSGGGYKWGHIGGNGFGLLEYLIAAGAISVNAKVPDAATMKTNAKDVGRLEAAITAAHALAVQIGMFETDLAKSIVPEVFRHIYFTDMPDRGGDLSTRYEIALKSGGTVWKISNIATKARRNDGHLMDYALMRSATSYFTCGALISDYHAKLEQVLLVSMNYAGPGENMHSLLGYNI